MNDDKPGLARTPEELAKRLGMWLGFAVVAWIVLAGLAVATVALVRWLA